jgi:hypothetical protein
MGETVVVYSSIKFHGTSATITRMLLQLHEIYAQHIPGKHCHAARSRRAATKHSRDSEHDNVSVGEM